MNRLVERLREAADRVGPSGVVGLAVLAFALAFWFSAVAPLESRRAELTGEAERLETRHRA